MRTLPACTCDSADCTVASIICTCPPMVSVSAPAKPLYGTCTTLMPRACFINSKPR
jgi:hypothetical protein